jgi:predicted RNase H-like HicB family nuclease
MCQYEFMKLKAIIHKAEEGGYWAEVPALPGCVTQGETKEELKSNLREAIEGWLAAGESDTLDTVEEVLELAI